MPGTEILSFGTAGCNLGCRFCQNWSISKAKLDEAHSLQASPEKVVELALKHKVPSIAFTYNDPVIWGEFVIDISRLAQSQGLKSVMVTAGYITPEARPEVFRYIDAANVDLKALSDGKNLNANAFQPDFKLTDKPATPAATLKQAWQIAQSSGIKYCYVGNVRDDEGQTTYCPNCHRALIRRSWHDILENNLDGDRCPCGELIPGHFSLDRPRFTTQRNRRRSVTH